LESVCGEIFAEGLNSREDFLFLSACMSGTPPSVCGGGSFTAACPSASKKLPLTRRGFLGIGKTASVSKRRTNIVFAGAVSGTYVP
jgi:hypothetical protein